MQNKYSYVYILSDENNNKLYIGVTSNLINRIREHKEQHVKGYTQRHNIHKLVYYEDYLDIRDALNREKQLKKWRREKKECLIKKMNPGWNDLYNEII